MYKENGLYFTDDKKTLLSQDEDIYTLIIPSFCEVIDKDFKANENIEGIIFEGAKIRILGPSFINCKKLKVVKLPKHTTEINSSAFKGSKIDTLVFSNKMSFNSAGGKTFIKAEINNAIITKFFPNMPINTKTFSLQDEANDIYDRKNGIFYTKGSKKALVRITPFTKEILEEDLKDICSICPFAFFNVEISSLYLSDVTADHSSFSGLTADYVCLNNSALAHATFIGTKIKNLELNSCVVAPSFISGGMIEAMQVDDCTTFRMANDNRTKIVIKDDLLLETDCVSKESSILYAFPSNKENLEIPHDINCVEEGAFMHANYKSITFTNSEKVLICSYAFWNNNFIEKINFKSSCTALSRHALAFTKNLKDLTFNGNVDIYNFAFYKSAIETLYFPEQINYLEEAFCHSNIKEIFVTKKASLNLGKKEDDSVIIVDDDMAKKDIESKVNKLTSFKEINNLYNKLER